MYWLLTLNDPGETRTYPYWLLTLTAISLSLEERAEFNGVN